MESCVALLQKSSFFDGINAEDINSLYKCLNTREISAEKDSFIFHAGDTARFIYLIVSGSMHIIDEDFWGNRYIIETMEKYTLFGEAYALSTTEKHLVSVIACENSKLLEIDPVRLFETCTKNCSYHNKLIKNTAFILSEKIVRLTQKLGHVSQRTMREKILSYLSKCARQAQSSSFYIPYSRQQLADYLCVDRSALSHELSNLQKSGLIVYRKNHFEIIVDEVRF